MAMSLPSLRPLAASLLSALLAASLGALDKAPPPKKAEAKDAEPMIASQNEVVEKLKAGLAGMKEKLSDLKRRRDTLVARAKSAEAQSKIQSAVSSINLLDPTSEVSRFEEKVRREEARVAGQAEISASSLDAQFEDLEDSSVDAEVAARLAALKGPTD